MFLRDRQNHQECLDKNGSGFCGNYLTNSRLAQLTDFVLRKMNKSFHTGVILVDLQKAYGTLDYTVPLQKMECIGF